MTINDLLHIANSSYVAKCKHRDKALFTEEVARNTKVHCIGDELWARIPYDSDSLAYLAVAKTLYAMQVRKNANEHTSKSIDIWHKSEPQSKYWEDVITLCVAIESLPSRVEYAKKDKICQLLEGK